MENRPSFLLVRCFTCYWELEVDLEARRVVDFYCDEYVPTGSLPSQDPSDSREGSVTLVCGWCTRRIERLKAAGVDPNLDTLRKAMALGEAWAESRDLAPEDVLDRYVLPLYEAAEDAEQEKRIRMDRARGSDQGPRPKS